MTAKNAQGVNRKRLYIKLAALLVVIVVLALLPMYGSAHLINIGILVFSYIALGQMWNLLAGYTGLVSLGQQAFIGIGAYTLAVVTVTFGGGFFMSFVISIIIAVLFSLLISFPIFKLSGVYFTIGTWIVSEAVLMFFRSWGFVNYDAGFNITRAFRIPQEHLYFGALALGILSIALVYIILRSRMGLALMAMRDDPDSAEVRGVHQYKTKLLCFLISSAFMAVTGVLLYMNITFVMPGPAFGIDWAVSMVFIVIIGGIGTIEGPVVGAVVYILLRQFLFNFPGMSLIILGSIAVIVILIAPKGIMGFIHSKSGFELFSVRRKMED